MQFFFYFSGYKGWGCTDESEAVSEIDLLAATLLLCLSNLLYLPAVGLAIYRGFYTESFVYFANMIASTVKTKNSYLWYKTSMLSLPKNMKKKSGYFCRYFFPFPFYTKKFGGKIRIFFGYFYREKYWFFFSFFCFFLFCLLKLEKNKSNSKKNISGSEINIFYFLYCFFK